MLVKVSRAEKRDISYYIIEGLERLLREKLEDVEDYEDAKKAYQEFVTSGEAAVPWDEMKQELKLSTMKYSISLKKTKEGFSVSCPGLPGCWSQGEMEEEALENIAEAIAVAVELATEEEAELREVDVAA